jgi:hypothetical protein
MAMIAQARHVAQAYRAKFVKPEIPSEDQVETGRAHLQLPRWTFEKAVIQHQLFPATHDFDMSNPIPGRIYIHLSGGSLTSN